MTRISSCLQRAEAMSDPDLHVRAAAEALEAVLALRAAVTRDGTAAFRGWRGRIERSGFAPGALNLAHYLALRRRDLRALQRQLMPLGVSSLGRLEGRTLATLDAVAVALAALAGSRAAAPRAPSQRQFFRGEARLQANAAHVLGPAAAGRSGRIMVTLPSEAADDPGLVAGLARRGAGIVRINCAHDGPKRWSAMIANARRAPAAGGPPLRVLMDIAGPKVRTGKVATPPDRSRVHVGDVIYLGRELCPPIRRAPFQMTCTEPGVLGRLAVGAAVSIDDGALQGAVTGEHRGGFLVRIAHGKLGGVKLKAEKGLNFPDTDLGLDPLTDKDRGDLDFIVGNADLVGYSFVQTAGHVEALQAELAARSAGWRTIPVLGKIETPVAVRNLPEIIVAAAGRQPFGVMIARGDLAVEMGFERRRRDAGGDPVGLRGRPGAGGMGDPGARGPGQGWRALARRDDRCGDGGAGRMRHAQQGAERLRRGRGARPAAPPDGGAPGQEDADAAGPPCLGAAGAGGDRGRLSATPRGSSVAFFSRRPKPRGDTPRKGKACPDANRRAATSPAGSASTRPWDRPRRPAWLR